MSSDADAFDIATIGFDRYQIFDLTIMARADLQPILKLACLRFRYVIIFGLRRSNNLPGFSLGSMLQSQKELFTEHWYQPLVGNLKRSLSDE